MLSKVRNTIKQHGLVRKNTRLMVAVSGGADSVALLMALRKLAAQLGITLAVCHLNHRIRGFAAEQDAVFVESLAAKLKIPCITGSRDVPRFAKRKHLSIEMAAREVRYRFFRQAAAKTGCAAVATGHTADDQSETFIIKLVRGGGMRSLSGIPYRGCRDGLEIIRPMLDVRHCEATGFLEAEKTAWREDVTNADIDILRNRVRNETLPFLAKTLNPKIADTLVRTANILSAENALLDEQAEQAWARCGISSSAGAGGKKRSSPDYLLNTLELSGYPLALRRRVVVKWLISSAIPVHRINFETVDRICAMVSDASKRSTMLYRGKTVRRNANVLVLGVAAGKKQFAFSRDMKPPCSCFLEEPGLKIDIFQASGFRKERGGGPGQMPASAFISLKKLGNRTIKARSWRPGDRMRPFGLNGGKKLKDIFIDAGVPVERKHKIPVFLCGNEIIWIPGYRIAEGWEVKGQNEKSLRISVEYE